MLALLPMAAMAQLDGELVKPRSGQFLLKNATVVTITKGTLANTGGSNGPDRRGICQA